MSNEANADARDNREPKAVLIPRWGWVLIAVAIVNGSFIFGMMVWGTWKVAPLW